MFSNSDDISHIIHWLIPHKRSTKLKATAIAPTLIRASTHNQIARKPTENSSSELRMYKQVYSLVTKRICLCTVPKKSLMPSLAYVSSRCEWENSFTV